MNKQIVQGSGTSAPIAETAKLQPETLALHAGWRRDPATKAVAVPIYLSTAFELTGDLDHIAQIYNAKADGFTYSRIINPTNRVLEKRFASLDGGSDSLAVASGQAATFVAVANLIGPHPGGNVVVSSHLYGNSWNLLHNTFKRLGLEARIADARDAASFEAQIDANTICLFSEVLSNPVLVPCEIRGIAAVGQRHGIPLVVDNTTTPLVCRPGLHGAAIATYSATKYICGHGTSLGGLIVDLDQFDWTAAAGRFPLMNGPDDAHGNIHWTSATDELQDLGDSALLLKARMTVLRDTGGCLSPQNAFQLIQGIETLPLRMERHCSNAQTVAEVLNKHPNVRSVRYPSLFEGREREIVQDIFDPHFGHGAMIVFDVGDAARGRRLVEAVELCYHVSNVGDARTLITHPVSTTHTTVPRDTRIKAGIHDGSIRLCVGIEHIDDILRDLLRALDRLEL